MFPQIPRLSACPEQSPRNLLPDLAYLVSEGVLLGSGAVHTFSNDRWEGDRSRFPFDLTVH
jgi:hypothetical protein